MATELSRLERTYQTAQRQLRQVRRTQMQMLQDPKVPSADIRRFNQRNLQFLLVTMHEQNIAARLWVREQLSAEQRARLLQRYPRFFGLRWFRAASAPGLAGPRNSSAVIDAAMTVTLSSPKAAMYE